MRVVGSLTLLLLAGCSLRSAPRGALGSAPRPRSANPVFRGALVQLDRPARYDASYYQIAYPGGDVPSSVGACSDVAIRALRGAGLDMQRALQDDHRRSLYPDIARPDANIDHRRVRNLAVYFRRHFQVLATDCLATEWRPGDIVTWRMPTGRDHIGIVSDRLGRSGWPAVVHNIRQVAEEDVLHSWTVVGHYRFLEDSMTGRSPGES
ncbi:MAG: DUF1287 domain-containing protein [Fimbriimonadaceae bacterium]|nr:DUF1287 domain-containing protein [Fimbriimonadaceae bacterium]